MRLARTSLGLGCAVQKLPVVLHGAVEAERLDHHLRAGLAREPAVAGAASPRSQAEKRLSLNEADGAVVVGGGAFLGFSLGRPSRLDDIDALVKWYRFEKLLKRLADDGVGRPAYPPLLMFKALLVQSLYGLSDAMLEKRLRIG
jgi:hypothetical protein